MKIDYLDFEKIIKESFNSSGNANYQYVDKWTSMQSLIVVSAIDEHYDILLNHNELKKASSLRDLFEIVSTKKAS